MNLKKFRIWIGIGAILCAIYVALGAFGAHALANKLTDSQLGTYNTGLRYLIIHALGLILVNFIAQQMGKNCVYVNLFFSLGILLFSFSLIIHALKDLIGLDINVFAMMAPIGGLSFILGWVLFSIISLKK
ncbi:DUF423 domain-containing protein [bacterium]|nr:DUF423 domain-containing protein [bacterium]